MKTIKVQVYFLRQADDFAISTRDSCSAHEIIDKIDAYMTIKVKPLGIIERFNGVEISQTRHYIKLSNATYINKITSDKYLDHLPSHQLPIPMSDNTEFNKHIEASVPVEQ